MKKRFAVPFLCGLMLLCGCNGVGEKDTILARINDEKVFKEDENILLKTQASARTTDRNVLLYDRLLGRAALVSRALSEYPELESEWDEYFKDIDIRILMMVYQRIYVHECLAYSEDELKQFYEGHRNLFEKDSTAAYDRSAVAAEYYVHRNQEAWKEFLAKSDNPNDSLGQVDTVEAKKQFVAKRGMQLRDSLSAKVMSDSLLVQNPLPDPSAEAYYEKHKSEFMTAPGYELYHIQADSAKLAKLFKDSVTLDEFKATAAKMDKNAFTAKDSGRVGFVKQSYALPYGLGVIPVLDSLLKDKEPGTVTPVVRSQSGTFHRFFLVRQVPSEQKPFERAAGDIKTRLETALPELDSSFVLVTYAGKPVFTYADYLRFNEKYFKGPQSKRAFGFVVNSFIESYRYAVAAKEAKLDHLWEYRALVRDTRADFIVNAYMEKKFEVNVSDDSLKVLFERYGHPYAYDQSFEGAKSYLKNLLTLPMNLYKREYYVGYRVLYAGLTFEQAIHKIYSKRGDEYKKWMFMRWMDEAYASAVRHIYDPSVVEHQVEYDPQVVMAKADSMHKTGNLASSYNYYRKLLNAYAADDSIFRIAHYEAAQVQNENEEYNDAEADFYAYYSMWPDSPEAEKALFTRGFILDENIKNDTLALAVLEEFQSKYPKSELKESVDWLVDNIKSHGKLADDLMKKIEAEE